MAVPTTAGCQVGKKRMRGNDAGLGGGGGGGSVGRGWDSLLT